MPTYEYECVECGAVIEIVQPITESARKKLRKNDPKPCHCNGRVRRRIGTGAGIIFKGPGFYETDYRSESYKKAAKADKEAATNTDSADKSTKSDKKESKTPAKKESKSPAKKKSE